jgi:apolipoprotein N-acyltransferase
MGLLRRNKKKDQAPKRPPKDILVDMGLCVLSGVLWFTACSDIDIWPFAWIASVPLMWVIHDKTPRKAFWYAMLAGFVANFGGFYWISHTLVTFARLPLAVGIFGTALLALYQALVYGVFGAVTVAILRRRPLGWTFVAPAVFVSSELLLPMEFPFYVAITQAWVRPVIQIADLAGPLGVTFMLLLFSGALFDLLLAWRKKEALPIRRAAIAGGLVVFTLVYGFIQMTRYDAKIKAAPKVKIGVIQANLGIRLKGRSQFAMAQLTLHHRLSKELEKRGAELIVWPESTHPFPLSRDRERMGKQWFSVVTRAGPRAFLYLRNPDAKRNPDHFIQTPLLVGVQTNHWGKGKKLDGRVWPVRLYNSAVIIDSQGELSELYDKQYLVTFSEQIPFHGFLSQFDFLKRQFERRHMSNFTPGTQSTIFKFGKYRIAPMICFEDILPRLGRKMAAEKPNVFINITNDAWFGATAEPYQHLALAVFRTIEHRRPMVRAVNTGTSTFIDATGRITVQTPSVDPAPQPKGANDPASAVVTAGMKKKRRGVWQGSAWPKPYILMESVAMMPHTTTVYAAVGWLFGWICLVVTLYLLVIHGRGLKAKLFRYRGDGIPMPDRRGRLVAPGADGDKPKPRTTTKKATPDSDRKPRRKTQRRKKRTKRR